MVTALGALDPSARLQAALAVGSRPGPGLLEVLVERCAVGPDFFVRDMLSWALARFPPESTLPRLRQALGSGRAQALHTLSKIGDGGAWAWVRHATPTPTTTSRGPRGESPSPSCPMTRRKAWSTNWSRSSVAAIAACS